MTGTDGSRITRLLARAAATLVLGAVLFAVAVLVVIPKATHGTALTVLTGSMTPRIPVGSIVIDRPVDPGTLHVGDIATYQKAPGKAEYITHRIVAINTKTTPTTFTFKGDANRGPDITPVPATAIRGKVWFHLPYLGAARDSLHTRGGIEGVAMLALLVFAAYQLRGWRADRRHPPSAASTPVTPAQVVLTDESCDDAITRLRHGRRAVAAHA
jgi:signal peptidase